MHGVDLLFVNAQARRREFTHAHVQLVQIPRVVAHERRVPVGELVARRKFILLRVDGFLKRARLRVEHAHRAVVRAREQLAAKRAVSPLTVRDVRAVRSIVQHAVVAVLVLLVWHLVDSPQTDVSLLIPGRDEKHGLVVTEIQVRHSLGHALGHVHVAQGQLVFQHFAHSSARVSRLRLHERPHLPLQRLDERRVRLLTSILTLQRHFPARTRLHRRLRALARGQIRRAVREHHRTVPPLSIHSARQLRRDVPRPRRSTRRFFRRRTLALTLRRDPSRARRRAALPAHVGAQRRNIERLHPRLIPRDRALALALECRQSILTVVFRALVDARVDSARRDRFGRRRARSSCIIVVVVSGTQHARRRAHVSTKTIVVRRRSNPPRARRGQTLRARE